METEFICIALAVLELSVYQVGLKVACLYILSAGIKGCATTTQFLLLTSDLEKDEWKLSPNKQMVHEWDSETKSFLWIHVIHLVPEEEYTSVFQNRGPLVSQKIHVNSFFLSVGKSVPIAQNLHSYT